MAEEILTVGGLFFAEAPLVSVQSIGWPNGPADTESYPDPETTVANSLRIDNEVIARVFVLPENAIPDDIKHIGSLDVMN